MTLLASAVYRTPHPLVVALGDRREQVGLSQAKAAGLLGFDSPTHVGHWERGYRQPSFASAAAYANLVGCDLTLEPSGATTFTAILDVLAQARRDAGLSIDVASRRLGYHSAATVGYWERGQRNPPVSAVAAYAALLGYELTVAVRDGDA